MAFRKSSELDGTRQVQRSSEGVRVDNALTSLIAKLTVTMSSGKTHESDSLCAMGTTGKRE